MTTTTTTKTVRTFLGENNMRITPYEEADPARFGGDTPCTELADILAGPQEHGERQQGHLPLEEWDQQDDTSAPPRQRYGKTWRHHERLSPSWILS